MLSLNRLLLATAFLTLGLPSSAIAITYGPTVKSLGPVETVYNYGAEACETWDIPDQPARAFRDDLGRVQLWFTHHDARRNIGSDLNTASLPSPDHHDCTVRSSSQQNSDASKFDDFTWVTAPYTLDGHTVYSLSHEEYRGWIYGCPLPPNGDTTKCWYNAITLETSNNSGDLFTHAAPPSHLVATAPYTWTNGTGPYGIFSPSNIIRKQPDDGFLYVIVRAKEPGKSDVSCVMRTQETAQALSDPTSWRAWGDGPDANSTDSFEVQFVNPYTYNFTGSDTPAKHMCKDIGGGTVTGVSESLTYNTYLGKYMLVGAYGGPVPGFYYSVSDDLVHWSQAHLLIGAETAHSWQCGDPDPVRDPSLLDPASTARNFDTTGKQFYVYYKIFNVENCQFGPNRDLLRAPVELQCGGTTNTEPTASFSASPATVLTDQAVTFDGSASTDLENNITDYRWDLDGDGTLETDTGATATTSRSYTAPGTVTVTLRVTDCKGATNATSRIVTINDRPAATSSAVSPTATPATRISCKTLQKKRAAVTRNLRVARRKLARAHTSAAKRRYRRQIASLRKRQKRLRGTPCQR